MRAPEVVVRFVGGLAPPAGVEAFFGLGERDVVELLDGGLVVSGHENRGAPRRGRPVVLLGC